MMSTIVSMPIWRCMMKLRLNNHGYMLVEIILATAIAFGIAYFILSMTIKLKNKNDDLLVETLTSTDQAIIANAMMGSLKGEDCDYVKDNFEIEGKKIKINGKVIDVVNSYITDIGPITCSQTNNPHNGKNITAVHVNVPIKVKQITDRNFNIKLDWILEEST